MVQHGVLPEIAHSSVQRGDPAWSGLPKNHFDFFEAAGNFRREVAF
jgi:hypothetical protein